jgi:hypothetical protein
VCGELQICVNTTDGRAGDDVPGRGVAG